RGRIIKNHLHCGLAFLSLQRCFESLHLPAAYGAVVGAAGGEDSSGRSVVAGRGSSCAAPVAE
ncbi:MAG: hypothetical protein ACLGRW_07040, partial [Acidobacteriota bacterium]